MKMNNLSENRKSKILDKLLVESKVYVPLLAKEFGVTTETIRRDLDSMEKENLLKRVHGGAVRIAFDKKEPPHNTRRSILGDKKELIGKCASSLVKDGDVIFIDVGTTTATLASHLSSFKNLTVYLNNMDALFTLMNMKLRDEFSGKIILLGGEIDAGQMSTFGPLSMAMLNNIYFDKAFLGVGGISLKYGITGYEAEECILSGFISSHSKETIVLADSSKIGVRNYYRIVDLEDTAVIVSDGTIPEDWKEVFSQKEIEWLNASSFKDKNTRGKTK